MTDLCVFLRVSLRVAGALALGALAWRAEAQTTGFAIDRFEPSERGSDWFVLDSLDLRGQARPAVGVVADWGIKPLVIYDDAGNERTKLVENQLFLHVGASLVLADRLRLGASFPVAIYQHGDDGSVNGVTYRAPDSPVAGDLRFGADLRLLGSYREPFTLALGAQVWVPTGDQKSYASDGKVRVGGHLAAAGDAGPVAYALRVGFTYRALDELIDGSPTGSEITAGAALGVRALERKLLIGVEAYGSTVVSKSDAAFESRTTPLELLLGLHVKAGDVRFNVGGGPGLTRGLGTPTARVVASIEWAPAYPEAPPPDPDRDKDGILNEVDACPDTPGVPTGDPHTNGCPAPPPEPPPDRDGDTIMDADDACPDVPGVKTNDPKTNGCPADRDGDGVPDSKDACPDVAGVATDDPKTNGCPPDRDGDGITDDKDACPDKPGPANPDPKKNGCPEVRVERGQILILEQVKFKTGSDVILPESDHILQAVALTLRDHPEIKRVEVQGHTDTVGGKALNQRLSDRRARSVVRWLAKHSVAQDRLVPRGFGMTVPIDTNGTPEGRQNNRRVEFHIIEVTR